MSTLTEEYGLNDAPKRKARELPYAPEAETGVLSCCLQDPNNLIGELRIKFKGQPVFYDLRHAEIWTQILAAYDSKVPVDIITLHQRMKDAGTIEQVGGLAYLNTLPDIVPSSAHWSSYADILVEKWQLRTVIESCTNVIARVHDCEGAPAALLDSVMRDLTLVSEAALPSAERSMQDVMLDVTENVLEKFRRGVKFKLGPQTGFNYLDNILPGLGRGQLIVEAARPRTGKSAKMMQTAEHIALVEKMPVGVFSLEMSARSLGSRAVFQKAGSDYTKFCNGFMAEDDIRRLVTAGVKLGNAPIYIDESPRLCIEDLEVRARRMVRKHGVKIIFVDYFQLLYVRNAKRQWSKSDELAEVSMRCKGLAKELDIPIYLAAQMNRQIEQDVNRRPRLSDLRDTGQLEQDADVVMFLWKPQPPDDQAKLARILENIPVPAEWKTITPNRERKTWQHYLSLVKCTVEKQREGRSGEDALMMFIKPWTRFVDVFKPAKAEPDEAGESPEQAEMETTNE